MGMKKQAIEPFHFYTRLHLSELTGLNAKNLAELAELIKAVPGSSIYHHTHRFLQQHQYLSPEPPNDFAYWVREVLGEDELGERLASIDVMQFTAIRGLRDEIAATIDDYLKNTQPSLLRSARKGEEFYFVKSVSFILPADCVVNNLQEFADAVGRISVESIYFHMFEARLRLEKGNNDFSNWIDTSLGEPKIAAEISRLDPYTYTMDELRKAILKIVNKHLKAA